MVTLLWIVYILDCMLLIGIILLQPGEGADLASAFGGASSQTAFGARGSATFMQKLTTALAVLFMLLSIVLVVLTNISQSRNIMDKSLPLAPAKPAAAAEQPKPIQAPAAGGTQQGGQQSAQAPGAVQQVPAGTKVQQIQVEIPPAPGEQPAAKKAQENPAK
jgi:preprotein translocase subunit SecG